MATFPIGLTFASKSTATILSVFKRRSDHSDIPLAETTKTSVSFAEPAAGYESAIQVAPFVQTKYLTIDDIGWSREQAAEVRGLLAAFAPDWDDRAWTSMINIKRGDIALVYFPFSDGPQVKKRPALIVQADDLNTGLPQLIVAQISSKVSRAGHPSRILINLNHPAATGTGLLTDSVIVTDNLATIAENYIYQKIGIFYDMPSVDAALRSTLSL